MTEAFRPTDRNFLDTVATPEEPRLTAVAGIPSDIRQLYTLLADGNKRLEDYRGCEERSGKPLQYVDPRYLSRPLLKALE